MKRKPFSRSKIFVNYGNDKPIRRSNPSRAGRRDELRMLARQLGIELGIERPGDGTARYTFEFPNGRQYRALGIEAALSFLRGAEAERGYRRVGRNF